MTRMIRNLTSQLNKKAIGWAVACAAATAFVPSMASAQSRDIRGGYDPRGYHDYRNDRNDRHDRDDVRVDIRVGDARPGYGQRVDRVWVEPVYRTDCDRVWVAAVYRTECDRVWVEPCYEMRDVVHYEWGHRRIVRERVIVSPGHYEDRPRQVLVSDGHWENVDRQVLVSAGHWEDRVVVVPAPRPAWSFDFGFGRW